MYFKINSLTILILDLYHLFLIFISLFLSTIFNIFLLYFQCMDPKLTQLKLQNIKLKPLNLYNEYQKNVNIYKSQTNIVLFSPYNY